MFRGKPVNTDPREAFVAGLMVERGERNPFHEFYKEVAQALFDQGVTSNVFCVNVDGVIAAWLLRLLWQPYRAGEIGDAELENAAFTIFLLARMAGSAAEIEDHLNRGRNMDTRTPASRGAVHRVRGTRWTCPKASPRSAPSPCRPTPTRPATSSAAG